MAESQSAEKLAKTLFILTMIASAAYIAAVAIFVL